MARIYHFISIEALEEFLSDVELRVPSLEQQGFIHCSTLDQVLDVANVLAPYDEELQLLEIDESLVPSDIRYENLEGGEKLFPHVYGPIPRSAIIAQYQLEWDGEEGYSLPHSLAVQV